MASPPTAADAGGTAAHPGFPLTGWRWSLTWTPLPRNLVDSMSNEVVVTETSITELVPGAPLSYRDAVREAYRQRAEALSEVP